jgi:hypothetical protein
MKAMIIILFYIMIVLTVSLSVNTLKKSSDYEIKPCLDVFLIFQMDQNSIDIITPSFYRNDKVHAHDRRAFGNSVPGPV